MMLRCVSGKPRWYGQKDIKTLGRRERNHATNVISAQDRVGIGHGIQKEMKKAIYTVLVNNSKLKHGIHFKKRKKSQRHSKDGARAKNTTESRVMARDPHLRQVLELASDQDLREIYDCVHAVSVFSPLAKSITLHDSLQHDFIDTARREDMEVYIESRFRFLAADCRHMLDPLCCHSESEAARETGNWPSYRDTLLDIRKQFRVPCPGNLDTVDLESELFLYLLSEHGDYVQHTRTPVLTGTHNSASADSTNGRQAHPERIETDLSTESSQNEGGQRYTFRRNSVLKGLSFSPLSFVAQGGTLPTLAKAAITVALTKTQMQVIQNLGHIVLKRAAYHKAITFLHGSTTEVGRRVAIETAKQRLVGAAVQYTAWRQIFSFVGPILWISAAWDLTKLSVGTDYPRLTRTVFLLAQIRLLKTRGWH